MATLPFRKKEALNISEIIPYGDIFYAASIHFNYQVKNKIDPKVFCFIILNPCGKKSDKIFTSSKFFTWYGPMKILWNNHKTISIILLAFYYENCPKHL